MEINTEKLKEILKEQREEYQRHLGVLMEMNGGVQKQLIALRKMVAKNRKMISSTFSTTRV